MSDSQGITEIINWCNDLNKNILKDKTNNDQFPKLCSNPDNDLNLSATKPPLFLKDLSTKYLSNDNKVRNLIDEYYERIGQAYVVEDSIGRDYQIAVRNTNQSIPTDDEIGKAIIQYCCTISNTEKKRKQVENAKQDFEIATQRAEVTRDPASNISRYGTHFAFGKPLRFSSIPYLLTIIIFFFILSIGILMEISGQKISITSSGPSWFSNFISGFTSSWSQSEGSFKIGLIVVSILVGALGYYGAEKLKEYILSKTPTAK